MAPHLEAEFVEVVEAPERTFASLRRNHQVDVRWKCLVAGCGHVWVAALVRRAGSKQQGCPQCPRRAQARKPFAESLAALHPALAAQLVEVPTLPGIGAEELAPNSNREAVWRCEVCAHQWKSRVNQRVGKGTRCPACFPHSSGLRPRERSLTHTHPHLVVEFVGVLDEEGRVTETDPEQVWTNSNRRVRWRCAKPSCGREWEAVVASRSKNGSGCPDCATWSKGDPPAAKSVAAHPHLAEELIGVYDQDGTLEQVDPALVWANSKRVGRWRCRDPRCAHEWDSTT